MDLHLFVDAVHIRRPSLVILIQFTRLSLLVALWYGEALAASALTSWTRRRAQ